MGEQIMNKHTQSLYDYVVFLMPEMIKQPGKSLIDPRVAKKLFTIWRDADGKISKNTFSKPVTLSVSDVDAMEKAGLVKSIGNNIEITQKGSEVLKIMILGDDSSSFDAQDIIVDYQEALAQMKGPAVRTAKGHSMRIASKLEREEETTLNKMVDKYNKMWWSRFGF
jgi:hypothetical protein